MCLWTIAEGVLVNTILDASSLPNYPKITGAWNPHIAQDGLYQRPYSFGQNSSVTGFCIAVVYMVIRRKSALLLGLLIITEVIVASGTGILMLAIVLFQKFRLKNLGTVVLITFFGLWFFDLKEFYVSNKLSLDYLDYLIELKTYQLREYSYFSTVEKFIGVKDSSSTFLKYLDKRKISLGCNIKVLFQEDFDQSLHIGLDDTNLTISIKSASNLFITKI